ncbi:MAG: hypothetical protein WKG07_18930 [Hymenobacter sp.]
MQHKLRTTRAERAAPRRGRCESSPKSFVEDVEFTPKTPAAPTTSFWRRFARRPSRPAATVLNIPDTTGCCLPQVWGQD